MNVFELFGTIAIKNRDANAALKDTATKAERTGKQIQDAFKKIGNATIKIGKGVISAATAIGGAWAANIETTRDYRTAMAKLDAAFQANDHSAETARETYKKLQRVLGDTDQATEAANHLAVLCENEQELDKWTDICQGVFATFGDSLPIESLTEAANETAKTGELTGGLADALNWAGINEEDFQKKLDACTTEEERQNLIMDTLYWTYKKAADQYEESGENIMKANEAQEKLNSAMAKIGEIGEPIMTGLKGWIADMVTAAAPHLQTLVDKLVNFDSTMENEVWPWIQKEAKMRFGVDLPEWADFKVDAEKWWNDTKTNLESWCRFTLAFAGILPWNEENQQALIDWWDGVYEKIGEIVTWKLPRPGDLTEEDAQATIMGIQAWWSGVISRIKLFIGITPHVQGKINAYNSDLKEAGGESAGQQLLTNNFTTNSDSAGIQAGVNAFLNWVRPDSSNASGLDYVPRDGYLARVHKGEAILTSAQASEWRGGGSERIESLLAQMVQLLSAGQRIQLDSGVLVGQLAPGMDAQLGTILTRKRRGS